MKHYLAHVVEEDREYYVVRTKRGFSSCKCCDLDLYDKCGEVCLKYGHFTHVTGLHQFTPAERNKKKLFRLFSPVAKWLMKVIHKLFTKH